MDPHVAGGEKHCIACHAGASVGHVPHRDQPSLCCEMDVAMFLEHLRIVHGVIEDDLIAAIAWHRDYHEKEAA